MEFVKSVMERFQKSPMLTDLAKAGAVLQHAGREQFRLVMLVYQRPTDLAHPSELEFELLWNDEVATPQQRSAFLKLLLESHLADDPAPAGEAKQA